LQEYKIISTLKLGKGVDHSIYNPVNKYLYVEMAAEQNAKMHALAIINTKSFKIVG